MRLGRECRRWRHVARLMWAAVAFTRATVTALSVSVRVTGPLADLMYSVLPSGWRQLTGENPLGLGPTFNELKTIVADPEWRDDPDGKATRVAMECVRELKEDSENS
jgi:hypothetical protein